MRGAEEPLRREAETDTGRAGQLAAELRRLGGAEAEVRLEASAVSQRATAIDVEAARLVAEAADARRRLSEAAAEPLAGERDELEAGLERHERRREQLGSVNPFARGRTTTICSR